MQKPNIMLRASAWALTLALALVLAGAASAQQPGRIRGDIEKVDGDTFVLKTRDGATLNVKLDDKSRIAALEKASLADIKNDSFMGIGGMPREDGSIEAFSIHILLPTQRGVVADRHGPWDLRPGSTMTNAYVTSMVAAKDGQTLTVKYNEGEKKVIVTPQTAIAAVAPGKKDDLKPGAHIIILGSDKQSDGSVLVKAMYVGRGLTPAM